MKIFKYFIIILSLASAAISWADEPLEVKEYGIVIIPSKECVKKAIFFNQKASDALKDDSITKVDNYWHVTLYHGAYQRKDLIQIYKQLSELDLSSFSLHFTDIYNTLDRWIDWKIINNDSLHSLHCKIVGIGSKYSQRPLKRAADVYNSLTEAQQKQVDKYGVHGILEYYTPHMTLFYAYPPNNALQKAAAILEPMQSNMNCFAASIAVGELGYNGNITNILYKLDLSAR